MPRASREQQARHRAHILEVSSGLFRSRGFAGTSVADLMAAAGLTHGGFYGHFESKDALAAEVCMEAFDNSAECWRERVRRAQGDPNAALRTIVEGYTSLAARDKPGTACPASTLAADVARSEAASPVREAYGEGIERLLDILAGLSASGDDALDRRRALVVLATLAGAQMLARATTGAGLSEEFLEAAREALVPPDG